MRSYPDGRKATGAIGEAFAVRYLEERGYAIVERNWRCRSGELDIVASMDDVVVILEVRTRRGTTRFGAPAESVDERKRAQVRRTAQVYLSSRWMRDRKVRFDVTAIILAPDNTAKSIEHYPNAF